MNLSLTHKHLLAGVIALAITLVLFISYQTGNRVQAAAPGGLVATLATTSAPVVTATASLVFATSSCLTRSITTYASPIMITFADNAGGSAGPTGTFGHLQAASSTVEYDGGQYGCGNVRIYSFVSQAITVSESR